MSASHELRKATAEAHRMLEATPFAIRLANGGVDLDSYIDYLRATAIVVANLRTAV